MVTGVVPSPPRFLPSIFIAHRVQRSRCSSIFHRMLLTHALALSASQFVHKKKSQRIYTSMHSAGLGHPKLTSTRLEDNLIRHRGDRIRAIYTPFRSVVYSYFFAKHTRGTSRICSPPLIHFLSWVTGHGSYQSFRDGPRNL